MQAAAVFEQIDACHVPSSRRPPISGIASWRPVSVARRCAGTSSGPSSSCAYQWGCVGTDSRVTGWRFLRDAKVVLSKRDLGERCSDLKLLG